MLLLRLLIKNAFRHPLRSLLILWGLAVAICALGLLRTVVDAWYAGPQATSGTRLITRNAVSMVATMPRHYAQRILALDGVQAVSWRNWFGGTYIDNSHFFAQFAIGGADDQALYPERRLAKDEQQAFLHDLDGAVIGAKLARDYGWKIGDIVPLVGTLYGGNWRFTVRGIYHGADENVDERQMFIHWQRISESLRASAPQQADQVGYFVVGIRDASQAAEISGRIDALFRNSSAETRTETEKAFKLGIVAMSEVILRGIDAVSVIVILTIMSVMASMMTLTVRERYGEYATLQALGFSPRYVAALLLGESFLIAMAGGLLGLALTFPVAEAFGHAVSLFPVFRVSGRTMVLQLAASAVVGLVCAAWPAWTLGRIDIVAGLRHAH